MDRRLFTRVPVEMVTALEWETKKRFGRTPVLRAEAITSDVSVDGACLDVSDSKGLRVGSRCTFLIGDAVAQARVLEIAETDSGGRMVRLSLIDAGPDYQAAIEAFIPTESAEDRERVKPEWAGD